MTVELLDSFFWWVGFIVTAVVASISIVAAFCMLSDGIRSAIDSWKRR